jgi:hypothetical protein
MDPERYRLPPGFTLPPRSPRRSGLRSRSSGKFLKGPISLAWLALAARQPGKALHVAVVLRFLSRVTGNPTVRLSASLLADFGVHRRSAHRGLLALEGAHLVTVQRHRGRQPRVMLLDEVPAR